MIEEFKREAHEFVGFIADYWAGIAQRPVTPACAPGEVASLLPGHAPSGAPRDASQEWAAIRSDLDSLILPNLTHWQHPGFFGFFPCNLSPPAVLAEFLSAGLNVNGMLWAAGPAITELEVVMMDWMADALGLPARFMFRPHGRAANGSPAASGAAAKFGPGGGVIQGTASEATLTALVSARSRAIRRLGPDARHKLCMYTSTQAHSSVIKAAMIAGLAFHRLEAGLEDTLALAAHPSSAI